MDFNALLGLYNFEEHIVLFKHVENPKVNTFASSIEKYRVEIQNKYENDEHLVEVLNVLRKVFFKLINSLLPYDKAINSELQQQLLTSFYQVKNSYTELFSNVVIHIAKMFKEIIEDTGNELRNYICNYINSKAKVGLKIAIVTKRAITIEERQLLNDELNGILKISFYTENGFRKDMKIFDEIIYIGTPNYFGDFVKNTFKAKYITFISYDVFTNSITPKKVFGDMDNSGVYCTIFEKVRFGELIEKKSTINLEEKESLSIAVKSFLEEQKKDETNYGDTIEASIVYLENDRFLFVPKDAKIRIFTPHDNNNCIKQINFKDIEDDDYLVIRNDRDVRLITEVADQDVLKSSAKSFRILQEEWKAKLRFNVRKKGLRRVSNILEKRYDLTTASAASVRSWCNEESICPTELPKLLKALKYDENKILEIHSIMKEIQLAHRKAGRIISEKLMSELSNDILKELQEKGFYTFESKEFNGASFNIERVVSIDDSRYLISPSNLMKPMNID
ncbi:hypothetical protein [Bacillus mycoides]|uniref:hypothetical protein n=1 Tax=Bacillus mycoides TaxID=1405 RepID=UPI0011A044CB|nr:hypothetical protein [Bacillus mycoides]